MFIAKTNRKNRCYIPSTKNYFGLARFCATLTLTLTTRSFRDNGGSVDSQFHHGVRQIFRDWFFWNAQAAPAVTAQWWGYILLPPYAVSVLHNHCEWYNKTG